MNMDLATCGNCGRTWDDSISTQMTPAPSGRCPFEYFHDGETVPEDWPVQPVGHEWQHGWITNVMTCARCRLLPLDQDDIDSECVVDTEGW